MRRRDFLGLGPLLGAGCALPSTDDYGPLADIEAETGGRVGVFAIDTATDEQFGHRADERFAMCSTFKWALAACVLSRVDRRELRLDTPVAYDPDDLIVYSPVTGEYVGRGSLTVAELCAAAVSISDNAAANLLLERVDGPAGLTAFLRQHGDAVTRLDRTEPELNSNLPGDPRDTTTPRAMAGTMNTLLLGGALSRKSRALLIDWMKATTTGLRRLRAGLPEGWVAGDKTGTSGNGAANDVAIAWPPGRAPILIAAYLSGSDAAPERLNGAHAAIGAAVAARFA